jgi:hypothetical protein
MTKKTPPRKALQQVPAHRRMPLPVETDNRTYSQSPMDDGSSFVVSEIVNPDGSVTLRKLVLNDDGSTSVEDQQYNPPPPPRPTMKTTNTTSSKTMIINSSSNNNNNNNNNISSDTLTTVETSHNDDDNDVNFSMTMMMKEDHSMSMDDTTGAPALVPASSWESSTQSSSSQHSRRSKTPTPSPKQTQQQTHHLSIGLGRAYSRNISSNDNNSSPRGGRGEPVEGDVAVSERTGHELRRQRLARSRKIPPALDRDMNESLYSSSKFDTIVYDSDDIIPSIQTGRRSPPRAAAAAASSTTATTEADFVLSSPPRPKRTTEGKHVAFLEPTTSKLAGSLFSSSFDNTSVGHSTDGDGSSMGYPIMDASAASTHATGRDLDSSRISTEFEGSNFFNARSNSSSGESTSIFSDLEYKRHQQQHQQQNGAQDSSYSPLPTNLLSSSPGRIKLMTEQASRDYYYDQYLAPSSEKGTYVLGGGSLAVDPLQLQAYSTPNASLDEILGPLPPTSSATSTTSTAPTSVSGSRAAMSTKTSVLGARPRLTTSKNSVGKGSTLLGKEDMGQDDLHVATIHKMTATDKVGIIVGIQHLEQGKRLVVSRISPSGKLADSGIEPGDIIVSINARSFLDNPSSQYASGKLQQ